MNLLRLSDRVGRIKPSPTLAVTARAAELKAAGHDVIGLGAGEPDFDTPEPIKEAAIAAIRDGHTKYTAVDGLPALRQAIADKFARENGLEYGLDQILVSCGGKQSFYNLAQALLNPGDEVVIPAPYWVSYPDMVRLADAEPVIVPTGAEARFKMAPDDLRGALSGRTRLVVINSPSNPTGVAYTRAELAALGEVLREHPDVLIATDDMYEHILWADEPFANIVNACPDLYERTIVLNGVSKAFAMTGWRIGYAAGPAPLIAAMKKIQSQSTSNPASISQHAALAALRAGPALSEPMVRAFRERHDFTVAALNAMPGVSCEPGDGTFYCFPSFAEAIEASGLDGDVAFAEHLIESVGVAVVPGSAFGAPGYMRISFATGLETLKEAMRRLGRAVGGG